MNDPADSANLFSLDIVDISGIYLKDYTCSFTCLMLMCVMLYSEGEAEDKTSVTVSFEALVNTLTMARNAGYTEANKNLFDEDSEEEALKEYMERDMNIVLN